MSLTRILLEDKLTEDKFERITTFLRKNYFHLVYDRKDKLGYSDYYLGQGKYGMVLHSEKYPDVILRVSDATGKDYKKAVGKNFENVVNVKFHKEIDGVYFTVMEKLESLPKDIEWDLSGAKEAVREVSDARRSHEIYWAVNEDPQILNKAILRMQSVRSGIEDIRKFFSDVINGLKELKRVGIEHTDMHTGNIMYDKQEDSYKIIDLD